MRNITVIAVGKLKERFWSDACAEYAKRLKPYADLSIVEVPDVDPGRAGGEAAAVEREGAAILKAIPEHAYVITLEIEGKERSSEEFAARLEELALDGKSSIVFIVGGSCGLSIDVRKRADESLSFGKITLPHNLARLVLLEQVYRCFKISHGEPYHK